MALLVRLQDVHVRATTSGEEYASLEPVAPQVIQCIGFQRYFTRTIHVYKRSSIPHMDYGSRFVNLGLQSSVSCAI